MVLDMVGREPAIAWQRPGELDTPARLFRARCREWATLPALRWKERGIWRTASWADYYARARAVGLALVKLGLQRGEVVAILSENRAEWPYVEFGALAAGAAVNAIHPDATAAEVASVLADRRTRILFVGNVAQLDRVEDDNGVAIVIFDARRLHDNDRRRITLFADFIADTLSDARATAFERSIDEGRAEDCALVVHGGDATGPSQMPDITNGNLMAQIEALAARIDLPPQSANLAFLPFSHIGSRLIALYLQLVRGTTVHFHERPDTVLNDIREVQPHLLYAPPRFWEKLHARVELAMRSAIRPARMLYRHACQRGDLAAWLVFPRLRASLGLSRVRAAISTGLVAPELVHWFDLLGIGLIDAEGWFGTCDKQGDSIPLPGHDAVALASVEAMLRVNPVVADARLFSGGDSLVCVILLDRDGAAAIAQEQQIAFSALHDLAGAPPLVDLIRAEIDRVNRQIPSSARIRSFRVLAEVVAGDARAMTADLRINRRLFARHYASLIEEMSKEVIQ